MITSCAFRTRWGREVEAEQGNALAEGLHPLWIQAVQVQGSQRLRLWTFIMGFARLSERLCQIFCGCELSLIACQATRSSAT